MLELSSFFVLKNYICGYGLMVECNLPKVETRVRFPLPAPRRRKLACSADSAVAELLHIFAATPFREKLKFSSGPGDVALAFARAPM